MPTVLLDNFRKSRYHTMKMAAISIKSHWAMCKTTIFSLSDKRKKNSSYTGPPNSFTIPETIAVTKCILPIGYLPTFVPAKVELDKVRLVVEGNCVLECGLGYDCHKLVKTDTSPKSLLSR